MKTPSKEEWLNISAGFEDTWNSCCIGVIDGKHMRIVCRKMTGTYYYNYKEFYNIVLFEICDSNYCFTLFDLRHYDSNNSCQIKN